MPTAYSLWTCFYQFLLGTVPPFRRSAFLHPCCVLPVLSCPDRLATCTQSHMSRRDFLKRAPKGNQYPPFNDQKYFHSCQCSEIFSPLYMTGLNRRCPPPCESFCVLCRSQTQCLDSVVRVEDCRSVARPSPLPYILVNTTCLRYL